MGKLLLVLMFAAGSVAAAENCTVRCAKDSMLQLDPDEVRHAHIEAIKMKILRHLGSHHASGSAKLPKGSREAMAFLAGGTPYERYENTLPERNEYEDSSRMVIFADEDIACPPGAWEESLLCLKFNASRIPPPNSIVRAELGIFFSTGSNETFSLRGLIKDSPRGTHINGTSSRGWVRFDVTYLATMWAKEITAGNDSSSSTSRSVHLTCSACLPSAYNQIRHAKESPFLMIVSSPQKAERHRAKRSIDCSMSNMQKGCCRAPFEVNFHDDIGWDWIVMPKTFSPNFCRGQCELEVNLLGPHGLAKDSFIKAYPVRAQSIELVMCCAPKKLKPLTIVYFVNKDTLNATTIPDMIVEECHCT